MSRFSPQCGLSLVLKLSSFLLATIVVFNWQSSAQHRFMLSRNWKLYLCVCTLVVIPDEQCDGMVRLWQKQITERLEDTSECDTVRLLFGKQNELEQVAQDQTQLDFEAESWCLNSHFWESWRLSLEVRHAVWNSFYLLSTFSNAFSGIKIHKCELDILRYLIFFILHGSRSEQLLTIYFSPSKFFSYSLKETMSF